MSKEEQLLKLIKTLKEQNVSLGSTDTFLDTVSIIASENSKILDLMRSISNHPHIDISKKALSDLAAFFVVTNNYSKAAYELVLALPKLDINSYSFTNIDEDSEVFNSMQSLLKDPYFDIDSKDIDNFKLLLTAIDNYSKATFNLFLMHSRFSNDQYKLFLATEYGMTKIQMPSKFEDNVATDFLISTIASKVQQLFDQCEVQTPPKLDALDELSSLQDPVEDMNSIFIDQKEMPLCGEYDIILQINIFV